MTHHAIFWVVVAVVGTASLLVGLWFLLVELLAWLDRSTD